VDQRLSCPVFGSRSYNGGTRFELSLSEMLQNLAIEWSDPNMTSLPVPAQQTELNVPPGSFATERICIPCSNGMVMGRSHNHSLTRQKCDRTDQISMSCECQQGHWPASPKDGLTLPSTNPFTVMTSPGEVTKNHGEVCHQRALALPYSNFKNLYDLRFANRN
jgi:hypothetical protein